MSKKFSVLISIYKNENPAWFREALDSVFAQTLLPSEIVLVKDGPLTVDLNKIIDEYSLRFPIFKIIENENNMGLGISLARGLKECINEIIARMDTDDVIPTDRFEKQFDKISEGYDVVSCWSQLYFKTIDNIIAIKKRPSSHDDIIKLAKRRSPVCHAACFFRKNAVLKAGNYKHCQYYEDYYLWIRMLMNNCKFYNLQEVLYYVRISPDTIGRRGGLRYAINEMKTFSLFRKEGFYSWIDLFRNTLTHIPIRLLPLNLRAFIFRKVWNVKSV